MSDPVSGRAAWSAMRRAVLFALVWLVLTGADPGYLGYGVVGVAAATATSLALLPPGPPRGRGDRRDRPGPLARAWSAVVLAAWFVSRCAVGGTDVARRALTRPVDIDPAVVRAPVRLPDGHGFRLALLLMNLMPGTMVQRVVEGGSEEPAQDERPGAGGPGEAPGPVPLAVELHTLDLALDPVAQWAELEERVGRAAGTQLTGAGSA